MSTTMIHAAAAVALCIAIYYTLIILLGAFNVYIRAQYKNEQKWSFKPEVFMAPLCWSLFYALHNWK